MRNQALESSRQFWIHGEMTFRVEGTGSTEDRIIQVDRPFALVGQTPDSAIRLDGPGISKRHVYLHLDPRGVFAVDLLSRTGTRLNGDDLIVGWLRPGDWLEIDDWRITLLHIQIDGRVVDPPPCDDDPLAETGGADSLVRVTLEPKQGQSGPWTLGSELIFLGWSNACGIQVKDSLVEKVHGALLRTGSAAYLVDLCGHNTRVDNQPVRGASIINDGATITIGATSFTVRSVAASRARTPVCLEPKPLVAHVLEPEIEDADAPRALDLVPTESQHALFAWMVDTFQQTQGTVLKQQSDMQATLVGLLRQVHDDNATLLNAHLERIERIDRELASLRTELSERSSLPPSPPPLPLP
ncbi:FHA domain-containing protein, partial (plasmid) [Singulisphaera sp. Ch08]